MSTPLQKQTGSPYWYADLREWSAKKGKVVRRLVSTKCTSKREAQKIADEMGRVANAVQAGANIVRVHDVEATVDALKILAAVQSA